MSRISYKIYDTRYPYFITTAFVDWLPLFSLPGVARILLDSLEFNQENRDFILHAYVIMENHLHLIACSPELSKRIRAFKSFTARKIVDHLKARGHSFYLKKLQALAHHIDSEYQVWQEGYHPKQIIGDDMMYQKITYIHNNPVKREYVDEAFQWRYSSARNYVGSKGLIPVTVV